MINDKVKNWTILILFILLAVSGTLNFIQVRNAKQEQANRMADNLRNQIETAGHKALAESYRAKANDLEKDLLSERDSFKVAQKPLYDENRALKEKIEIWRPLVAEKIATDPDLKEFSSAQDSAILVQSKIIASLEIEKANEISKNDEIRNENRKEVNELVLMTNSLQESWVKEQANSRKWEKKAGKRFGLGVQAGWGVMSTGGEVRTGPTVNVGLQWRLARF